MQKCSALCIQGPFCVSLSHEVELLICVGCFDNVLLYMLTKSWRNIFFFTLCNSTEWKKAEPRFFAMYSDKIALWWYCKCRLYFQWGFQGLRKCWGRHTHYSKSLIFMQKFNSDIFVLLNIFEFLRQNWKMFVFQMENILSNWDKKNSQLCKFLKLNLWTKDGGLEQCV